MDLKWILQIYRFFYIHTYTFFFICCKLKRLWRCISVILKYLFRTIWCLYTTSSLRANDDTHFKYRIQITILSIYLIKCVGQPENTQIFLDLLDVWMLQNFKWHWIDCVFSHSGWILFFLYFFYYSTFNAEINRESNPWNRFQPITWCINKTKIMNRN